MAHRGGRVAPIMHRPGEPGHHHAPVMRIAVDQQYPVTGGMGRPRRLLHPDGGPGSFSYKSPSTFGAGRRDDKALRAIGTAGQAMPKPSKPTRRSRAKQGFSRSRGSWPRSSQLPLSRPYRGAASPKPADSLSFGTPKVIPRQKPTP
jgi:hypothetical protein